MILENKYGKKVTDLYLICIHPDNVYKNYQRIQVPVLTDEMKDLIEFRMNQIAQKEV
jgi:hypothetical protein